MHRIGVGRDEARLGTPSHDELTCPATASDTMHNDGLVRLMMLIHQVQEAFDLDIGRHAVVRHIEVMIHKLLRHVLAVVELAAIDHRPDLVFLVEIKDIRIRPPRRGDDAFDDPGEGLGSFGLTSFGPIPGADRLWHGG